MTEKATTTKSTKSTKAAAAKAAPEELESSTSLRIPGRVARFQKRVLETQRSAFENGYGTVSSFQEGREDAFRSMLERSSRLPVEARELAEIWIEANRARRESFKAAVVNSYGLAEQYLDGLVENEGQAQA